MAPSVRPRIPAKMSIPDAIPPKTGWKTSIKSTTESPNANMDRDPRGSRTFDGSVNVASEIRCQIRLEVSRVSSADVFVMKDVRRTMSKETRVSTPLHLGYRGEFIQCSLARPIT